MSEHDDRFDDSGASEPARDELDSLLRAWHEENRQRAAAGRDRLLAALAAERADAAAGEEEPGHRFTQMNTDGQESQERRTGEAHRPVIAVIRRIATHRASRLAAALLALAVLLPFILPGSQPSAAAGVVMCPQGGRLVAFAPDGEPLGPCVLKHTGVDVDIAGPFARITLRQQYHNPNPEKIEAVYTFPMSHHAAVDGMKMVIGNRIVEGEIKERSQAQQLYAAAREQGRVASLLEQERPNIFTQSVANIEPGAEIAIEISYIELLPSTDGQYTFSFPATVAPRYIPGRRAGSAAEELAALPEGCEPRRGLVLLAPAPTVTLLSAAGSPLTPEADAAGLAASLDEASPIETPAEPPEGEPALTFAVTYPDGARETGALFESGLGVLGGRWFYLATIDAAGFATTGDAGAPFSAPTDEVPDAARITPTPVQPPTRAGHDLSITVHIDTGGPGILDLTSPLHEIVRTEAGFRDDGVPRRATIKLKNLAEIPNRDFVLTWRQTAERIEDQVFTAAGGGAKGGAGFFTLLLQPPQRVADEQAMPRELVFVLDVSGSMQGQPIEKAKDVLTRALASMRPQDRFNIIKFNNSTGTLWDAPRAATGDNLAAARAYFSQEPGGGGTEMMQAIRAALQMPRDDAGDADPREANPLRLIVLLSDGEIGNDMAVLDAVKSKPADTRFFTFSIGNAANRYLLDSMAKLGGGKAAYVLQTTDAAAVADAFARRINTPVLTNVKVEFRGVRVSETFPPLDAIGDLYDVEPLVMHGRFEPMVARLSEPEEGVDGAAPTILISGMSGAGPWQREIPFPRSAEEDDRRASIGHDQIATLWARAKVESLLNQDLAGAQQGTIAAGLKDQIVSLGERFNLLTQYTAFVAVDKLRITVGGQPRLVNVPIELPNDASWEGYFGPPRPALRPMPAFGLQLDQSRRPGSGMGQSYFDSEMHNLDAGAAESLGRAEVRSALAEAAAFASEDEMVALDWDRQGTRLTVSASTQPRGIAGEAMIPPATLMGYPEDWRFGRVRSTAGLATDASASRITLGNGDPLGRGDAGALYGDIPLVGFGAPSEAEQLVRQQLAAAIAAAPDRSPTPEQQSAHGRRPPARVASSKKDEAHDGADARTRRSAADTPSPTDAPREIAPATEAFQSPAPSEKAADEATAVTTDASEPAPSRADAQSPPPLLPAIERTAAKIRAVAATSAFRAANEDVGLYWSHPTFAPTLICELHVGSADPTSPAEAAPDIAAAFAEHFAALYPDDAILTALHAAYQDDTLDAAALTARVRELADESWENVLRIERLATLQRRLDPRLLALVRADAAGQEPGARDEALAQAAAASMPADAGAAQPPAATLPTRDGKLLLSILVDDVAAAKQPLTDAGASILVTDETMRLIVAAATPDKLADLALSAGVRRIEPASME